MGSDYCIIIRRGSPSQRRNHDARQNYALSGDQFRHAFAIERDWLAELRLRRVYSLPDACTSTKSHRRVAPAANSLETRRRFANDFGPF
jgi:hypothetical protein